MLANFFEKTKPINSIAVAVIFFLYFLTNVFFVENFEFSFDSLGLAVFFLVSNFVFLFFSGVVIINNKISNDNLFAPFFMVLLFGLFPKTLLPNSIIYILLLFAVFYRRLSALSKNQNYILKLFDSGLCIGVMFLLYNWSILYLILVYVALLMFQKITIRKILIPIVGMLVPILFWFTYAFAMENMSLFYECFEFNLGWLQQTFIENNKFEILGLTILIVLSVLFKLPKMLSVSTLEKQHYTITLFSLILGGILFVLNPSESGAQILFVFVPVSIVLGQLIGNISKRILKDSILVIFIAVSLIKLFTSYKI